jgi:uncharacterized protein YqgQ
MPQIKRNHTYLVLFIIHLASFLLLRYSTINSINKLETNHNISFNSTEDYGYYESVSKLVDQKRHYYEFYGIVIIISAFLVCLMVLTYSNKLIKYFIIAIYILYFSIWGNKNSYWDVDPLNDEFYLTYYVFVPYIYFIIKYSFIGVNNSDNFIKSELNKNVSKIIDLEQLLKKGIISKEEFILKQNDILKQNIIFELEKNEEFVLLKKAFNNKILTKEEFNSKKNVLINKLISKGNTQSS